MARYRMTPRRKAALRKAQLVSARKRKGKGKSSSSVKRRRIVKAAGYSAAIAVAAGLAIGYGVHKRAGGKFSADYGPTHSPQRVIATRSIHGTRIAGIRIGKNRYILGYSTRAGRERRAGRVDFY